MDRHTVSYPDREVRMTEPEMRELVMSVFATAWAVQAPGVPLALENEALPTSNTFALLTIQPTTSAQITMNRPGARRVKRSGWLQVKLWGPVNAGSAGLSALGDVAQGILELQSFPSPVPEDDPVTTYAAQAGAGGASTDGRFYMALVRVPFYWLETR